MYLIVGLGNPGSEYHNTRHNVGFEALDRLIEAYAFPRPQIRHRAMVAKGNIGGIPVLAAKPLTFMNLSGEAVRAICDYYKIDPENELIVLCDDIYLQVGSLRIRGQGSDGGHNGLKDIIRHLGTQKFVRMRIGVGDTANHEKLAKHVLGKFSKTDRAAIENVLDDAAKAAALAVTDGLNAAMNRYNKTVPGKEKNPKPKNLAGGATGTGEKEAPAGAAGPSEKEASAGAAGSAGSPEETA